VPSHWPLELGNGIARLEAKNIVTEADSQRFIMLLGQLDIVTDTTTADRALGDTLNLARGTSCPCTMRPIWNLPCARTIQ
jgi:hypothetical protein